VHPGYGFLAENAEFAEAVEAAGLVWIGPPADAIRAMGDKAEAKRRMIAAGVPCVPGYEGEDQSDAALIAAAGDVGFPVMVKAAAGGGGKGMRLVAAPEALSEALVRARAEALAAFGYGALILERAISRPRHVEIQVFADAHGACVHLGERDCSVQRRHQKVIEEAPCPVMTPELHDRMGAAAVAAAEAVGYRGAGTVEFLLDDAGAFYFLEMNTRLQVEHPVTEMVTGLDLVALQIRVAEGLPLGIAQADVTIRGHAMEARLYAEDPGAGFLPATGRIAMWRPAAGARVDAGIVEGGEVSPHYDPMLAKIVAWGETREAARRGLIAAVRETALLGVATNSEFLEAVLETADFVAGEATTALIDEAFPAGFPAAAPGFAEAAAAGALALRADQEAAFAASGLSARGLLGWSSAAPVAARLTLESGGERFDLEAIPTAAGWSVRSGETRAEVVFRGAGRLEVDGRAADIAFVAPAEGDVLLAIDARRLAFRRIRPGASAEAASGGRVTAPMPGLLAEICVAEGQTVRAGERLAVVEAMKMQHQVVAPMDGVVARIATSGGQVAAGELILELEEDDATGA
jgi:geranyl-CoA carboxylase alpha subunit